MGKENTEEVWIQVGSGPEATVLRTNADTARVILESRLAPPPPTLTPVPTNGPEGTTLLVEPERVASVQAQIEKTSV